MTRHPVPLEAPPENSALAIKVRNMLIACPGMTLDLAIAMHDVQDVEMLILQMMTIEEFKRGEHKH